MFQGERPKTAHDAANDDASPIQPLPIPPSRKACSSAGGALRLFGNTGAPAAGSKREAARQGKLDLSSKPAGDPCRFGPKSGAGSPVTNESCSSKAGRQDPEPGGSRRLAGRRLGHHRDDELQPVRDRVPQDQGRSTSRGTVVTLEYPLAYYHFGGPDPGEPSAGNYRAARDKNWGVDERAEVGLITRNIELRGSSPARHRTIGAARRSSATSFKEASIQGVEFAYLGKPKLGSYPVHFHVVGGSAATRRCCSTQTASIIPTTSASRCTPRRTSCSRTMVCARAVGHLFYQEIGDEEDITFQYNLGLGAMSNNFDIHAAEGSHLQRQADHGHHAGQSGAGDGRTSTAITTATRSPSLASSA